MDEIQKMWLTDKKADGDLTTKLNQIRDVINSGNDRYAVDELNETGFFVQAFRNYPKNDSPEIIAMKISLVDTTNSTNLSRILGYKSYYIRGKHIERDVFTMEELIAKLLEVDFDNRVKRGDASLVSELTRWGQDRGANMMSFFSKYCLYHNYYVYDRDDYSIFDSVVQNNLGRYISEQEFKELFPNHKLRKADLKKGVEDRLANAVAIEIGKMKRTCDYEAYNNLIGDILRMKNITTKKARRKFDLVVWYENRLTSLKN